MSALMSFSYFPSNESVAPFSASSTVIDPICGERLTPVGAAARAVCGGVTYYFCSEECHRRFTWQAGGCAACADQPLAGGRKAAY